MTVMKEHEREQELKENLPIRFGKFYLYDLIGQGGMAEIFLAKEFTDIGTANMIVVKRILPHLSDREGFGEMLIQEAKLCSRLSHANVVQTFDLGQVDGQYYIGMEYVEGFDLNRLLGLLSRAKLAMPLPYALHIIIETLRGLDYAHRVTNDEGQPLGIIHRDVSPTNVLISVDGDVKVCDFGIAKVTLDGDSVEYVNEYHLKGKVAYMSPEHLNGESVDLRADLYAAGILLWELLSGRRLFKRQDVAETMALAKEAVVPPLEDRGYPDFEKLEAIVYRALKRNSDERYQTGRELIEALEEYMMGAGLIVSSIKFCDFLMENFGENLLEQRREREHKLNELMASQRDADETEESSTPDADEPSQEAAPAEEASPTPLGAKRKISRNSLIAAAAVLLLALAAAAIYFGQG